MAALVRQCSRLGRPLARIRPGYRLTQPTVFISTSKKNKDVITALDPMTREKSDLQKQLEKHFENLDPNADKNWISYGYDDVDKDEDRFIHGMTMFITVTFCLVGGSFIATYLPDQRMQEWSLREAFLELDRREREGLDLISPDLIAPKLVELPPEEEISEEIVI